MLQESLIPTSHRWMSTLQSSDEVPAPYLKGIRPAIFASGKQTAHMNEAMLIGQPNYQRKLKVNSLLTSTGLLCNKLKKNHIWITLRIQF